MLQSELDAMIYGIQLCQDRGLVQAEVETDELITSQSQESWRYEYSIRRIRMLMVGVQGIKLIYREQNAGADGLAKWARGTENDRIFYAYNCLLIPIKLATLII